MTQVVMHPALAEALQEWRRESLYHRESDWVFASVKSKERLLDQQESPARIIFVRQP